MSGAGAGRRGATGQVETGAVMMHACMLCGKGSLPPSVGHRADHCQATSQEQVQWIQNMIPVQ